MAAPIRTHKVYTNIRRLLDRLTRMSPAGRLSSQLLQGLLEGQLEYHNRWDDLRAPATSINPPGIVSDPDIDEDGSFLFDHVGIEQIAIILQMPHAWKEGSGIRPHVHWQKTTDAAGDVIWELRHRLMKLNGLKPAWSSWMASDSKTLDPGSTQAVVLYGFPEIDMAGYLGSAITSFQLRRNTGASDTYGTDARLWEFDLHYLIDGHGSEFELVKGDVD